MNDNQVGTFSDIHKILNDDTDSDNNKTNNDNFILEVYSEKDYTGELTIVAPSSTGVGLTGKSLKFYKKPAASDIIHLNLTLEGTSSETNDTKTEYVGIKDHYGLHNKYKVRKTISQSNKFKLTVYDIGSTTTYNRDNLITVTSGTASYKFFDVTDRGTTSRD